MTNTIQGLSELQNKLKKLKGVKDNKTALLTGAFKLEGLIKESGLIPVVTGFLKSSGVSRKNENGAEVAWTANYSEFIEFGTSKMKAQPFIRPTIDSHSDEVVDAVAKVLKDDISDIAGG